MKPSTAMNDRENTLPNPFASFEVLRSEPTLADIVAAIELELRAFIDKPLADEFAEGIQ